MIEHLAHLALLGTPELASAAPELASGASSLAGKMVEGVGRRFASGVYEEIREKLTRDTSLLGGALSRTINGQMTGAVENFHVTATSLLSRALESEGATVASVDELTILRKLATAVAEQRDSGPALDELKQFYANPTASS